MQITDITLIKILNSLGDYTLQCTMQANGFVSSASVPQGKSAGVFEATMLSAESAIEQFKLIKQKLLNVNFNTLKDFDDLLINLDGTDNKSKLGGNLTLVLSICFVKLLAQKSNLPLYKYIATTFNFNLNIPTYFLLIFEGGKHGSKFITAQEYMLLVNNITEAVTTINSFKEYLDKNELFVGYGLEGAFTSSKLADLDVLKILKFIAPKKQIAIDIAQSSRGLNEPLNYNEIVNNFNIYSIEDPCDEKDYDAWGDFYKSFSAKIKVIGDDLTTTNTALIDMACKKQLISGVIIKPNQIGTVYQTLKAVKLCNKYNLDVIVSHRGGDTNDDFIADLSVGVGANFVKFGGLQRGERIAKFNRLEQIRQELQ